MPVPRQANSPLRGSWLHDVLMFLQMDHAVFARRAAFSAHPVACARIRLLSHPAGGAEVEGNMNAPDIADLRQHLTMAAAHATHHIWGEEEQEVGDGGKDETALQHSSGAQGIEIQQPGDEGEILDLNRNDEKQQDGEVRPEPCECQEYRSQHPGILGIDVDEIRIVDGHANGRQKRHGPADSEVDIETERPPLRLKGGRHHPEKIQCKQDEDRVAQRRYEDEGDQPPDFS